MQREYILKLHCYSMQQAEEQKDKLCKLLAKKLATKNISAAFNTKYLFDFYGFENRIHIEIFNVEV